MTAVTDEKSRIREHMKKLRSSIDVNTFRRYCMSIMEQCKSLGEWQNARVVHIYVSSVNNEVDTLGLIITMLDLGKLVVVPRCSRESRELHNIHLKSLDELKQLRFGLMEPDFDAAAIIQPEQFNLIVVPVLAFDRSGARLGFGGGYYDRLLSRCSCPKVGVAYSFQEVERVPVEPHDRRLDSIITEKETIQSYLNPLSPSP